MQNHNLFFFQYSHFCFHATKPLSAGSEKDQQHTRVDNLDPTTEKVVKHESLIYIHLRVSTSAHTNDHGSLIPYCSF